MPPIRLRFAFQYLSHPITLDFMCSFKMTKLPNATMQLEDIYGNVVWEVALSEVGSISETVYLSTGEPPAPPVFVAGQIPEGGTQTARVSFFPLLTLAK